MANRRVGAVVWMRLALAGSLLMALTAFVCLLRVPVLPLQGQGFWAEVWAYRLRFGAYLLPFALGLGLMVWAERHFKRGYRDDLWTEAELAEVRRIAGRKIWAVLGGLIVVFWILVLSSHDSLRGGSVWYALLMPGQLMQRVSRLIAPRVERASPLSDWHNFGPIQSEHWGEGGLRS